MAASLDPASASDGPLAFLTREHRDCDALWANLEEALDAEDEGTVGTLWPRFDAAMRRHLAMEEEVIFPALEAAMGMRGFGPVQVMKHEHMQMRALLDRMAQAALSGAWQEMMDEGDTLLMMVGQHNAKEEGVLYPMIQQRLASEWSALSEELSRY
ncbi:MAG: hemerythrin domain-containing protein [Proteobacteria bacterium]|nr:hemerythrin domain-containing protein [Pseudomonadota bacterium]